MKKILTPNQLHLVDQQTISKEGINSLELTKRASSAALIAMLEDYSELLKDPVVFVCGKGNNGADGLQIAKLLQQLGAKPLIYLLQSAEYSPDNLSSQKELAHILPFSLNDEIILPEHGFVVDCLFGFGLKKELDSSWGPLIDRINSFQGTVLSIDMPSGLASDTSLLVDSSCVQADKVYTFELPKWSLLMPENAKYVPAFRIVSIGLDQEAIQSMETQNYYLEMEDAQERIIPRSKFSHKGTYGHALIIGGSLGKMGAPLLCSKAAMRSGCGLLDVMVPQCGQLIVQTAYPEAMLIPDSGEEVLRDFNLSKTYQAIAVGVGMGQDEETIRGFGIFLQSLDQEQALVLDADALNILAKNPSWLPNLPKGTILSPHPKELSRLIGEWHNDEEKLARVKGFAQEHQLIVLIKGAHTAIICPDGTVYFNSTGNPGMATAGSGDTLTGILVGLLAQGMSSSDAAILGVYIHGYAADLAANELSEIAMLASDITAYLPKAWLDLQH